MRNIPTQELLATIRQCTSEICETNSDNTRISIADIYRCAAAKLKKRADVCSACGDHALAAVYADSQFALIDHHPNFTAEIQSLHSTPHDEIGRVDLDRVRLRRSSGGFTYFQN